MIKSIFVTLYIMASMAGVVAALFGLAEQGLQSAWLGTVIACGAPALFFSQLILMPRARTSRNLHFLLVAGVLGTVLSAYFSYAGMQAGWPLALSVLVGIAGSVIYVYWYSRFGAAGNDALKLGARLPDFELVENGKGFSSAELSVRPALWIFYRGNWCPLCVAQIREVAAQYRDLARRGVDVFLVSPQSEENSQALSKKMDAPMRFMTDAGNRASERLGILVKGGLPAGFQAMGYDSDVPRPTVFITKAGGELIYCDMTDNYRVRPEPSQFFTVLDRHAIV